MYASSTLMYMFKTKSVKTWNLEAINFLMGDSIITSEIREVSMNA